MSTLKPSFVLVVALAFSAGVAVAQTPRLGKPVTEADIAAWDISAMPDGTGLPPGSGTPEQGAKIYMDKKCGACHGPEGKGKPFAPLVGGAPLSNGIDTPKTVANFWGYSTIVFDFIRRAMPFQQPRTLTNDEVYALTAYILALNKIIGENDMMDARTLPQVRMPNRDGFIIRFPELTPR